MPRSALPGLSTDPQNPDTWGGWYNAVVNELSDRIDAQDADVLDVKVLGAPGDGSNANAAFLAAQLAAKAAKRPHPTASDYVGSRIIDIPAGDYLLTDLKAVLGLEVQADKVNGIKFRGAGPGLTNIIFTPTTAGALVFNDYWLSITFEAMSFITTYSGATFMQSYTTHNAQAYNFTNVSWTGPWLYIFDLQGTNNNSEFRFYGCSTSGMLATGAFMFIGASGSDQFLNYWFFAFKHWSTSAPIIDATKGGHFHFYGLDVSDWGTALAAAGYIFNLRGSSHSSGVCSLTVEGMRVEAKSVFAGLIYSEWGTGNVTIECDWSSQISGYTYGDIISIKMFNVGGPVYNFHDSNLAGGILVNYGPSTYQYAPRILIQNTIWHQKLTPSEAVTYVETSASPNFTRPTVEFVNCKSDYNDYSSANGFSTWDVTLLNRQPVMPVRKRALKVGSLLGGLRDSNTSPKINLPLGALITGLTAICPAGVGSEADGGTWTVATTDTTPVTIVAATVTTALNAGYLVAQQLAVPYLCATRAQATVTVTATNVTTNSYSAFLILEGYW
jgi:hypothetical protein